MLSCWRFSALGIKPKGWVAAEHEHEVLGDDLVLLDPDSGATKWLGSTGVEKLFGVGYDNDTLYGFSSDGEIVRINPKTGAGQIRDRSDSLQWWGATTNPVRW